MKKKQCHLFIAITFIAFIMTGCEESPELTPQQEFFAQKNITLPSPPPLSKEENENILAQKKAYEEAINKNIQKNIKR